MKSHPIFLTVAILSTVGCGSRDDEARNPQPASSAQRAARRAFEGAPPVIPHPPLSGACQTCHTPKGTAVPGVGLAPANPHGMTRGIGSHARCRQCHVHAAETKEFQPSTFVGLEPGIARGERAHALAPPTIPHAWFMHEDCLACHSGMAARPDLRCTHPERARCAQCHVHSQGAAPF